MSSDSSDTLKIILQEYTVLKDEQNRRTSTRDGLIYTTLAALAGTLAAVISTQSTDVLLVLPPVCLTLGWTYLMNDHKITAIGTYIREVIATDLQSLIGSERLLFQWEDRHRNDPRRRSRKVGQSIVDLTIFGLTPFVAVLAYWVLGSGRPLLLVASVVEALATVALAYQILAYADVWRATSPARRQARDAPLSAHQDRLAESEPN